MFEVFPLLILSRRGLTYWGLSTLDLHRFVIPQDPYRARSGY